MTRKRLIKVIENQFSIILRDEIWCEEDTYVIIDAIDKYMDTMKSRIRLLLREDKV